MKTLRAHGFSQRPRFKQVVPLPLDQPANPQPLQHTPLKKEGFRTPAEATDEDLARMRQGGGNRFGEDDRRADEQRTGPALHHGPSAQRGRRSAGGSGPCGRRSSRARGGAGLPLPAPQDVAEYVRLNVLPRPGPQPQPPPQIIGRPDDVERLLDEAGQRAQEVQRGAAQAIEETAAVAAEEGEVAVAAEGVGGAFGYLGGLARRERLLERWLPRRGWRSWQRRGWPWDLQAAQPTAWPAARAGCWRTRSSGLSRAARTRPRRTSGPPTT